MMVAASCSEEKEGRRESLAGSPPPPPPQVSDHWLQLVACRRCVGKALSPLVVLGSVVLKPKELSLVWEQIKNLENGKGCKTVALLGLPELASPALIESILVAVLVVFGFG